MYQKLHVAVQKAYPQMSKSNVQAHTNKLWSKLKKKDLQREYGETIVDLNRIAFQSKSKVTGFFSAASKPKIKTPEQQSLNTSTSQSSAVESSTEPDAENPERVVFEDTPEISAVEDTPENVTVKDTQDVEAPKQKHVKPAQEKLMAEIGELNKEIASYSEFIFAQGASVRPEQKKQLKKLHDEKAEKEKRLKRKIIEMKSSQKVREKKAKVLSDLKRDHPEVASKLEKLEVRTDQHGPIPIEESQPGLHQAILDVIAPEAGADIRRRTEVYNSVRTLDQLHSALEERGFRLSRSATYYRLIPANARHRDAKRHVNTVPVKLLKPRNDLRKKHIDGHFAMASVKQADELAELFPPETVLYISQDDKAKVPLGLPISKKQTAILMHLEYKVLLPDHDFAIAPAHKLIPSVMAACLKKDGKKVGYGGPTLISIRSMKHDSSTAASHVEDFDTLIEAREFQEATKTNGKVKPLVFMSVDGGPDEAPKNLQAMAAATRHFLLYDLDAIFVFAHAPGSSAYNKVERRMAPLSKLTAEIVLPFDTFGTHLDSQNKTVDDELEMMNFEAAGKVLSEVWNNAIIDDHPVVAKYVNPPEVPREPISVEKTQQWISQHVRQSQYMVQVVKCGKEDCCSPFRSNYIEYFPKRFLPGPIPLAQCKDGLVVQDGGSYHSLFAALHLTKIMKPRCYDEYCPSIQLKDKHGKTKLEKRSCPKCHLYHSTIKAMKVHKQECTGIVEEYLEEDSSDDEDDAVWVEDFEEEGDEDAVDDGFQRNIFHEINKVFGIE